MKWQSCPVNIIVIICTKGTIAYKTNKQTSKNAKSALVEINVQLTTEYSGQNMFDSVQSL